MIMSNDAYHRIGVALCSAGAVLLLTSFAQQFWGMVIFDRAPILPSIAFVICGAALIVVAKTGEE